MPQPGLVSDSLLDSSTRVLGRAFGALVRGNGLEASHAGPSHIRQQLYVYSEAETKAEKIAALETAATEVLLLIAHEQESGN